MLPKTPAFSFTKFNWLAAAPLMTIHKLAIYALDTKQSSLKTYLSKAKHFKSLWLGFGSWTTFGSCAKDQVKFIQTTADTVGPNLDNPMLTHRYKRDYREMK